MSDKDRHRVCLASPVFYPTYGGSQLRFLRYLPGLGARDLEVWVYTGTPHEKELTSKDELRDWNQYPVGELMPVSHVAGTPVHRVHLPNSKGPERSRVYGETLLSLCRDPLYRPDVLQMVGPLKADLIPLLKTFREMGIPTIYAVTVAPPKDGQRKWYSRSQRKEVALHNLLSCIVTNNQPLLGYVRALGIETRVEIIPNGVDLKRFRPSRDPSEAQPMRAKLGVGSDAIVMTTVGGVMPRKGSDILIDAWTRLAARFPDLHLVLVGPRKDQQQPGLREFGRRIEALIDGSGARERVHFTGICDDVDEILRATDLFVLPSEREGMPNSVLEAMASRIPVVMTPFKGLSEDLGVRGEHYMLCDRNAEALSAGLARLIEDPGLRRELAASGYALARATMDLEMSVDRYAALYHELSAAGAA